jgi:hypothetical protein
MCYTSYSCITQNPYCVGATPNTCRTPQPYYCDTYLQVSNNCATCGCPSGQTCKGDGTCSPSFFDTDNIVNIDLWANALKWFAIFAAVVLFFVGVVKYASSWNN